MKRIHLQEKLDKTKNEKEIKKIEKSIQKNREKQNNL
jgi:hypothetical protein